MTGPVFWCPLCQQPAGPVCECGCDVHLLATGRPAATTVPHPNAVYVVDGPHGKRRHYRDWTGRARCFWWTVIEGPRPAVYDLAVCGRCAAIYPRYK